MMTNLKTDLVRKIVLKLNNFPSRSIARYILEEHGGSFDNDLEKIRARVRYVRGQYGERMRTKNKQIIKPDIIEYMPETWRRIRTDYNLSPGRWLILSDAHIPFHEKIAIEAAIKYGIKNNCTGVLLNGDQQDCQAVSYWPSVSRKNFMAEVMVFIDYLDYLRQEFPKAQIVYKPGNHEYRLPRYYASHCSELIGSPLTAMESLIDFEGKGIEFLDYFQIVRAGKLPIFHGHEFKVGTAVNPARGLFLKTKKWAACAHYHRTSEHTDTDIDGTYLTTWSFGCLCDLKPEYNPYGNNWNWGCAVIEVKDNGDFEVNNKRILPNGEVA